MDVIELAKECGAEIDNFVSDTDKNLVGITFWGDELQAFAEAIKRDLLDVGMEPRYYRCEWPHSGGDNYPEGTDEVLIDRLDAESEKDYQVALKNNFVLEPLFTAEQMAHSRSEAVREAVSKQKEKDAKICDEAYSYSSEPDVKECAIAIRNQGE